MFKQTLLFVAYSITILFATMIIIINITTNKRYVTGEYSKYCYNVGEENGNIKKKIYYETLSACAKPLK